jgi:predicted unusual protein kinase regulating ubiquinone biosynthesis (AarF/ABC1/UbiB family)
MNANLNELIAALPDDDGSEFTRGSFDAQDRIRELAADIGQRRVPVSSLHRLWIVGELSAQIALAYFALWVRRGFADAETARKQLMETNLRLALKMFHRLAYMRGAMTKIGQAAGNFPNILPDQIADTLERLHFDAPPMHFSLIKEIFQAELGKNPEDLFATFDRQAFAAASLGQVHRAQLKSGEEVAVKIQYPGVARTIDADFRNLSALLFPMRLGKDWESTQASFDEIHRMLRQEVDYRREAESLREAHDLFQPPDGIVVPRVYQDYSTHRVLTMEFIRGLHLPEFLATDPPQGLRDRFGTKMYVAWKRIYDAHMNYADPSSGNYLFMNDGRLGLLDFGCVQHFDAGERELIQLSLALLDSLDTLRQFLRRAAGATDSDLENPEYIELMTEATKWTLEPAAAEGPFDFGSDEHLRDGLSRFSALARKGYARSHPMWLYFHRSVFGLRAVLYRLRARVDVRAVFAVR